MSYDKAQKRLKAIREIISSNQVSDHQTLIELMNSRYGIDTSQAVISRDLRALGISKRAVGGKLFYELPTTDASREILRLAIITIVHNESMIVIKTLPGLAAFVADYLDLTGDQSILATISGENVVFVCPLSTASIKETLSVVYQLTEFKTPTTKE